MATRVTLSAESLHEFGEKYDKQKKIMQEKLKIYDF